MNFEKFESSLVPTTEKDSQRTSPKPNDQPTPPTSFYPSPPIFIFFAPLHNQFVRPFDFEHHIFLSSRLAVVLLISNTMPPVHSSPYFQMDNPRAMLSLLRHATRTGPGEKRPKSSSSSSSSSSTGGVFRLFKLLPMLTTGCKMVALLGRPNKPLLKDGATTVTIFGYRKGRIVLAIHEDPYCLPNFVLELPMLTSAFHKEMASEIVRIALESETRTHKKKVMEEFVWAVYCNGKKVGYSIRRKQMSDDEEHVMHLLRGVSMGAGVLPSPPPCEKEGPEGELTYLRARFERAVGSKDSEALYMINPDGAQGPELSIFFVRVR